ncbi:MAG: hypothetical protein LQ351_001958 [Letrouitia transgressa]|nr:MAG: hypothetical protein LQ351_001958 [Letrouitia transgressa]
MILLVGYAATHIVLLNSATQTLTFGGKDEAKPSSLDTESRPNNREIPERNEDQDQKYFKIEWRDGPPLIRIMEDTFVIEKFQLYYSPYPLPEIEIDVRDRGCKELQPYEHQIFRSLSDTIDAYFHMWYQRITPDTKLDSWGRDTSESILNRRAWELAASID